MNKDDMKGKMENMKGRVKEAVGSLTGDKKVQAEGTAERAKGAVREKFGQAKEEIEKETETEPKTEREEESEDE